MSKIEERLWMDLIREPEAEAALGVRRPPGGRGSAGPALVAAGGIALIGVILAAALALRASTSTTPAFAVSVNQDGSVSLTLREVIGVRGANAALAKLGVRARVAQKQAICHQTGKIDFSRRPRSLLVEPRKGTGNGFAGIDLVIHANQIPRGDTLLITVKLQAPVKRDGKAVSGVGMTWGLYRGVAPSCRPQLGQHPA